MHPTLHQRLKAISLLQSEHTVSKLCHVLKVNRSTFYKYINKNLPLVFLKIKN
ncbi:TPA: helix-turn-helix domain-containing protein [Enterococcus faecalis]|nr:helix-turn-helix domain-containing protein [Enterococcus faecalis]